MRKIIYVVYSSIFSIMILAVMELIIPNAKGLTGGLLSIIWMILRSLFLKEYIIRILLFFIGSICFYGTINLSAKKEHQMWSIASAIVSLLSFFALFQNSYNI